MILSATAFFESERLLTRLEISIFSSNVTGLRFHRIGGFESCGLAANRVGSSPASALNGFADKFDHQYNTSIVNRLIPFCVSGHSPTV